MMTSRMTFSIVIYLLFRFYNNYMSVVVVIVVIIVVVVIIADKGKTDTPQ